MFRLLSFLVISICLVTGCSDQKNSDPDVVLLLVEKWPREWTADGVKALERHAALKQLMENSVAFTNAFTASPEVHLAEQALQSGMHTGHLLSGNFNNNNFANFKNSLLSKDYKILEYSDHTAWSGANKTVSAMHIIKLSSNNLSQLNDAVATLLTDVSQNTLVVLTALSGTGTAYSESSLRVPLIFYTGDDKVKKGISQQAIYTADLLPTIADFLNAPYDGNTLDGKSFYKNIKRPTTPLEDRILYWKSSDKEGPEILRYNQWKMRRVNPQTEWQLFDMITDPEETDNVSAYHPGKFEKFQEWVEKNK